MGRALWWLALGKPAGLLRKVNCFLTNPFSLGLGTGVIVPMCLLRGSGLSCGSS